jgi:predicted RNase H-like nuclease (RuvC/YqgF family)
MARPKGSKNKKTIMAAATSSPAAIQAQIEAITEEIASLTASIKEKKAHLKKLQKEIILAEKAAEMMKAEKDKAAIMAAIEASGKSVDEILEMLK